MSIESPDEYKVPPQDQKCKVTFQDHTPRSEDDIDSQTTSTVRPKYSPTQRVKKVIETEYDEEGPSIITRTKQVVSDITSINTEEQVVPKEVNLSTIRSSKKGQVIISKAASLKATLLNAATSLTSKKIKK